jgi:hypothetical protein
LPTSVVAKCERGPGRLPTVVHGDSVPSACTVARTMSLQTCMSSKPPRMYIVLPWAKEPACIRGFRIELPVVHALIPPLSPRVAT